MPIRLRAHVRTRELPPFGFTCALIYVWDCALSLGLHNGFSSVLRAVWFDWESKRGRGPCATEGIGAPRVGVALRFVL
jgi:hypothetical protein